MRGRSELVAAINLLHSNFKRFDDTANAFGIDYNLIIMEFCIDEIYNRIVDAIADYLNDLSELESLKKKLYQSTNFESSNDYVEIKIRKRKKKI